MAETTPSRARDIHQHAAIPDTDLENAQCFRTTNHIEHLYARRKVRPINDLAGTNVKARPVQRALHLAILQEFAASQWRQDMRTTRLSRKETIRQVIKCNLLVAHGEGFHLANNDLI